MTIHLHVAGCASIGLLFGGLMSAHAQTEPEKHYYFIPSTLKCPAGERLAYFFYAGWREDLPELRSPTWCGAADQASAYASKVDPAQAPYRTEVCNEGHWWTYSFASPTTSDPNRRIVWGPESRMYMVCYVGTETVTIRLSGPSHTKALPAGPVLPQTATVTSSGMPAVGKAVSIRIERANGIVETLQGETDSRGEFGFVYVPPYWKAATDTLVGNCSDCSNTATKTVTVEVCEVCNGAP